MKKFLLLFIFVLLMFPVRGNAFLGTLPFINPGPQNVISGGTIDNTPIGATTPSTGAFTTLSVTQNFNPTKGSDVASAGAMTLGNGNLFDITGVTTINTIATKGVGSIVVFEFDGILQLTHSNDLFLPTAANITTAAGDIATFYEYATGDWRCFNYMRADGSTLVDYMTASEFTSTIGAAYDTSAELDALFAAKADESVIGTSIGNGLRLDGAVLKADRDFRTLPFTNGASQTAFSEADMLAYSAINNQGAGEETDIILTAVSYPIQFAVETSEAFSIELCPPAGEIFTHDGTALDANDCVLSSAVVGDVFIVKRRQIADASWQYFTFTVQGVNTDGGPGD